jgi:hypothetical protein
MSVGHAIRSLLARNVLAFQDINRRYANPRIKMSWPVRVALLALRIYLLVLLALLAIKFYALVAQ